MSAPEECQAGPSLQRNRTFHGQSRDTPHGEKNLAISVDNTNSPDYDENRYWDFLNEREDFFEQLAEEIEPHLELTHTHILNYKNSSKPLSYFALFSMFPRIESIRLGIYAVARINEFYSINILFRAMLEHTIKFKYLFMKTVSSISDETGIDYWTFGHRKESIDYVKNLADGYALFGIKPNKTISEMLNELGIISAESSQAIIKKRTEQFTYKNMVRYLSDKTAKLAEIETSVELKFFPLYSELSSFVHGGAQSTQKSSFSIETAIDISSVSSLSAKYMNFILGFQYDKRLSEICIIHKKYLDDYQRKFIKPHGQSRDT